MQVQVLPGLKPIYRFPEFVRCVKVKPMGLLAPITAMLRNYTLE